MLMYVYGVFIRARHETHLCYTQSLDIYGMYIFASMYGCDITLAQRSKSLDVNGVFITTHQHTDKGMYYT